MNYTFHTAVKSYHTSQGSVKKGGGGSAKVIFHIYFYLGPKKSILDITFFSFIGGIPLWAPQAMDPETGCGLPSTETSNWYSPNWHASSPPAHSGQQWVAAQWAKLANLGSVLISVKNIFIKSQKYFEVLLYIFSKIFWSNKITILF